MLWVRHQWRVSMLWRRHEVVTPGSLQELCTICPAGMDQSRLLVAVQPVTLHVKLLHTQHQRHDKNACSLPPFSPVCFSHYFHTERDIFVSFVSSFHQPLHTSLLHLSPSVLLSYFKETWQQETVWLQRATW